MNETHDVVSFRDGKGTRNTAIDRRAMLHYGRVPRCVMLVVVLAATTGVARAEDSESEGWEFILTPYVWALAISGDVTLGQRTSDLDIGFGTVLSDLQFFIMGEGEARKGNWSLFVNGLFADLESDRTSVVDLGFGDFELDGTISIDYAILEGGLIHKLGEWPLGKRAGEPSDGYAETWSLDVYGGARYTDLKVTTFVESELGAGQAEGRVDWVDPIVGLRTRWNLDPKWSVLLKGDIGGFGVGSDFAWRVFGGVTYEFARKMKLVVGYKGLYDDYEEGSGANRFEWAVTLHGPLVGLSMGF